VPGKPWWKHLSRDDIAKASPRPPSAEQLQRRAQLRIEIAAMRLTGQAAGPPLAYVASTTQSWRPKGD
jgi:hypothetical protein